MNTDITFEKILGRIRIIDRDVSELNRLKSRLPADRPYSPSLQISFDKQINFLLTERVALMDLAVANPPEWLFPELKEDERKIAANLAPAIFVGDLSVRQPAEQDVINFIRALPKTEIHLHLEACVNKHTLKDLLKKNNVQVTDEEFEKKFNFNDLNGFIQLFFFIQSAVKSPEDFGYMISSLAEYLRANNIVYAEVFFAPSKFIQNGLDFEEMIEALVKKVRQIKLEDGTEIRILVDVSRSFGNANAMNNLNRVLKIRHEEVIGIGLGGPELLGPAKDYVDVFKIARESGLRTVAHAGEDDGPWSIWDTVKLLQAERIGHGTSAIQDPELVKYLKEKNIPIEICLTSNIFTGKYVRKEENHPVRFYYDQGLITSINTDDPEIFNVNLTYEYFKLYRFLNFTLDEIIDILKKGVYATFHPNKDALWASMESKIQNVKRQFNLN